MISPNRQLSMSRARSFGRACRRAIRDGRSLDAAVLAQIAARYAKKGGNRG